MNENVEKGKFILGKRKGCDNFFLHFLKNYPPPFPYLFTETLPGVGAPAGVLQQGVCRGRPQGRGEENTQQP